MKRKKDNNMQPQNIQCPVKSKLPLIDKAWYEVRTKWDGWTKAQYHDDGYQRENPLFKKGCVVFTVIEIGSQTGRQE